MSDDELEQLRKAISFVRKPSKMGDRYFFSIPKVYIESGFIDPDETYVLYLAKKKKEKD